MTIKQLILKLQLEENQDRIVVCQSDPEGNDYAPLEDYWTGAIKYSRENKHDMQVGAEKLTPELKNAGYTKEDVVKNGKPALFLVPQY